MTIRDRALPAALAAVTLVAATAAAPAAAAPLGAASYELPPPVSDISAAPDGSLLAVGGDTVHQLRDGEVSTVTSSPRGGIGLQGVDAAGGDTYWLTVGGDDLAKGAAVLQESHGAARVVGDVESFEVENDPDAMAGPMWKDPRCEAVDGFTAGPQSNPYHLTARSSEEALVADAAGNTVLSVPASSGVDLFALLTPPVDAAGEYRVLFTLPDGTDCYVQPVPTSVAIAPDGAVYVGELTGAPAEPGWSRVWRVEPGASGVVCPSAECTVAFDGLTSVIDLVFGADGMLYVLQLDNSGWLAAVGGTGEGGALLRCDPGAGSCSTVADGLAFPNAITFDEAGHLWVLLEGTSSPRVERLVIDDVDGPPSTVPFVAPGTVSHQDPTAGALSPVDVRFGMHEDFDRIVVDLVGEGTPGWFVQYTDDPRYGGSGAPVDVDGQAFLSVSVTGVQYPTEPGAAPYEGPDVIDPEAAGIVEEVVVGSIWEGGQELFVGVPSAQPYRVFVLEDPTRLVIDVQHPAPPVFATEIAWMLDAGIATGYADGFRGATPVSRQAMAAFTYRLVHDGADAPACTEMPFPDVSVGNQFCGEIAWMEDQELTRGYDDGTFRPTTSVSRQAMAAFFYRLYNETPEPPACEVAPFADVAPGHPFCAEIFWMLDAEISEGYDDATYRPTWPVSRQAMAAFMYRAAVEEGLTPAV